MIDYKCAASIDGMCRNQFGFGARCNGHSDKCRFRNLYYKFETIFNKSAEKTRKIYGIVPSDEDK